MKPIDLDELERLEAAATPVEWHASEIGFRNRGPHIYHPGEDLNFVCFFEDRFNQGPTLNLENAQFVAALRNAFPALLRELRARRRQVERARETLGKLSKGNRSTSTLLMARMCRADLAALDHIGESTEMPAAPAKGGEGGK